MGRNRDVKSFALREYNRVEVWFLKARPRYPSNFSSYSHWSPTGKTFDGCKSIGVMNAGIANAGRCHATTQVANAPIEQSIAASDLTLESSKDASNFLVDGW